MWPFKKKAVGEEVAKDIHGITEEAQFSDAHYSSFMTTPLSAKYTDEEEWQVVKPEKPDWYDRKWELVIVDSKYQVRCDGLWVRDKSYRHLTRAAAFSTEIVAVNEMYIMIWIDIESKAMSRREGEVVTTWP